MYTSDYSYENEKTHLSENDVLESYKKTRMENPGAIVVLKDLDCGHWDVEVYDTPERKEVYYRQSISKLLNKLKVKFNK